MKYEMTTGYGFRKRTQNSIYKNIEVYRYNYFDAYKKEDEVYNQSVKFSQGTYGRGTQTYENSLEYTFYNFQLLIELLTRFQRELNISDNSIKYVFAANEDLKLCYRFLYLGYYNSSGIHMRGFFEKMIYFIWFHFNNVGKIIDNKKQKYLIDKINSCLKVGELSHKNSENEDTYNAYYFPVGEIMKLHQFYSIDYIHDGKPNSNLCFDPKEFKKIYFLIELTLIYLPRFLKVTIGKQIQRYWKQEILNPVEGEYKYYGNYLQYLFGENKMFTDQYSTVYNFIHDDKDNQQYAFEELKLDKSNLFEKAYLDDIALHNRISKKAKGNRDKYADLMAEHYKKNNFKPNS